MSLAERGAPPLPQQRGSGRRGSGRAGLGYSSPSRPPAEVRARPRTSYQGPTREVGAIDTVKVRMKLALVLVGVWVLLSGILSPLLLGFGLASSLAVAWLAARADRRDGDPVPFVLRLGSLARYLLWLAWEIVKANVDVSRRILSPSLPIAPAVRWLPASQRSELGRVIYADSITLTPGTLSIDLVDGWVEVHALNEGSLDDLARNLDMDERVSRLEPDPARSQPSGSEPVRSEPPASEPARSQPPASGSAP